MIYFKPIVKMGLFAKAKNKRRKEERRGMGKSKQRYNKMIMNLIWKWKAFPNKYSLKNNGNKVLNYGRKSKLKFIQEAL